MVYQDDAELATISAAEVLALPADGHWLLDVREQHEWDAGHAPLAHHLPMSAIEERTAEIPSDRQVYVVCHSGQRSARVSDVLLRAGYDAVNVAGGMVAWLAAGGDIVAEGPDLPRV